MREVALADLAVVLDAYLFRPSNGSPTAASIDRAAGCKAALIPSVDAAER